MKITKDGELYSKHRTARGVAKVWRNILYRHDFFKYRLLNNDGSPVTGEAYQAIQREMNKLTEEEN